MKNEFVIRGMTSSGKTETLNFSGHKDGYGYVIKEFDIFPSSAIGSTSFQASATISAGKSAISATDPNFNDDALIATALMMHASALDGDIQKTVINDTFVITQNLILSVHDVQGNPVNWQCRFESVKLSGPEQAVTNYKQFIISDE